MEFPVIRTFLVSFNVAFAFANKTLVLFKASNSSSTRFCEKK